MPCRSGFEDHEIAIQHSSVKRELDTTTALLCSVMSELRTQHLDVFNSLITNNQNLYNWYNQHKVVDENRWYAHYKDLYPNFSKVEIIKLIDNKLLPKI